MSRRTGIGLSRERVLQAGLRLVDREGVEALTMRRLGRELGVEAMSLYGHIANKQDLLDGVVDCVYAELPSTGPDPGPWPERLRTTACEFRQVLLRHPNVVGLVASRPVSSQGGLELIESALLGLRDAGLDIAQASQALSVVVGFTVGHVANQVGSGSPEADVDWDQFPNVIEWADLDVDPDAEFELGLDLILAGVSHLLEPGASLAR
jgi:AcrR family transcriptional regulator